MVFLQGFECVLEDPLGDIFSELTSVEIGGASMNPLVDASFDNVERASVKLVYVREFGSAFVLARRPAGGNIRSAAVLSRNGLVG
jgi:hypothetical protein